MVEWPWDTTRLAIWSKLMPPSRRQRGNRPGKEHKKKPIQTGRQPGEAAETPAITPLILEPEVRWRDTRERVDWEFFINTPISSLREWWRDHPLNK
ncbi:hypothetical protein C4568_04110 [Candidatus Parcubacteria bacterium]|nr:MAG: hypothetical protein C4568_04110 [Candidatus Parcubacteria bacterium]